MFDVEHARHDGQVLQRGGFRIVKAGVLDPVKDLRALQEVHETIPFDRHRVRDDPDSIADGFLGGHHVGDRCRRGVSGPGGAGCRRVRHGVDFGDDQVFEVLEHLIPSTLRGEHFRIPPVTVNLGVA
uniref:Uncharacterized protein n=1 Tax=uncultured marine virus TaxID=186617 RepID=A0A0F7L9X6_9VIRU|nr:hypothetical protein [uncultured marine virus]